MAKQLSSITNARHVVTVRFSLPCSAAHGHPTNKFTRRGCIPAASSEHYSIGQAGVITPLSGGRSPVAYQRRGRPPGPFDWCHMFRELTPPSAALRFLVRLDATLAMRSLIRIGLADMERWEPESDSDEHHWALGDRKDNALLALLREFNTLRNQMWEPTLRHVRAVNALADEAIAECSGGTPFNPIPIRKAAEWLALGECNGWGGSLDQWSEEVCQKGFDFREAILGAFAEVGRTVSREVRFRPVFQHTWDRVPLTLQDIAGWVDAADAAGSGGGKNGNPKGKQERKSLAEQRREQLAALQRRVAELHRPGSNRKDTVELLLKDETARGLAKELGRTIDLAFVHSCLNSKEGKAVKRRSG